MDHQGVESFSTVHGPWPKPIFVTLSAHWRIHYFVECRLWPFDHQVTRALVVQLFWRVSSTLGTRNHGGVPVDVLVVWCCACGSLFLGATSPLPEINRGETEILWNWKLFVYPPLFGSLVYLLFIIYLLTIYQLQLSTCAILSSHWNGSKRGFIISNIYSMGKDELGNLHFPIVHGTSNTLKNSFSNSTPDHLRVFSKSKNSCFDFCCHQSVKTLFWRVQSNHPRRIVVLKCWSHID